MTTRRRRIERLCYPTLVASVGLAVVLALTLIWSGEPPDVLFRLFGSSAAVALGSGFMLAATRELRDETT